MPVYAIKNKIMEVSHDAPMDGHLGFLKTYQKVRERFTWKGLKYYVLMHVREFFPCQQKKVDHTNPARLLHPLSIL